MSSIHETAYPRFKLELTQRELEDNYMPSDEELKFFGVCRPGGRCAFDGGRRILTGSTAAGEISPAAQAIFLPHCRHFQEPAAVPVRKK